jgi:hypothetical protein
MVLFQNCLVIKYYSNPIFYFLAMHWDYVMHCFDRILGKSSRSDFSFEFSEIFVSEKRLAASPSRGVDKIAYRYNFFQTFKYITLHPRLLFCQIDLL